MLNKLKLFSIFIFLNVFGSAQDAGASGAISNSISPYIEAVKNACVKAVKANNLREVKTYVPLLGVNSKVFAENTLLDYAVRFNSEPIVRYLLEKGACINIENRREDDSLLDNALCTNINIAVLLLENGATPNAVDKEIILNAAIRENQPKLLELSLKYFVPEDFEMTEWYNRNHSYFREAIDKNCRGVAMLMIGSGKLDFFKYGNVAAFVDAFKNKFYEVVDAVLERVSNKELFFNTVIRYYPKKELAAYLIKSVNYDRFLVQRVVFALGLYGCNSNSDYKEMAEEFKPYETPDLNFLHNLLLGDVEAVKAMLEENKKIGNTLFYIANECMSSVDIAIYRKDTPLLRELVLRIGRVSQREIERVINVLNDKESIEIFKIFLDSGADFTVGNYSKFFLKAVALKDLETVKFLLEKGVPVDYDNGRALISAVRRRFTNIVDFLLQNGARVGLDACLKDSIMSREFKIARMLLEAGADINAHDGELLKHLVDSQYLSVTFPSSIVDILERLEFALRNGADVKYLKEYKIHQDEDGSYRKNLERLRLLISFGFEPDSQTIADMKRCEQEMADSLSSVTKLIVVKSL